ncbi:MAG: YfiR family protein [Colwellia sp.]|nr:YfiR family protein [Colwellia sp.]
MTYRVVLIILLTVCASFHTNAQTSQREYALKAGLMYYFALYSQNSHSESADISPYVICSSSKPFVEVAQNTLADKKIRQRDVKIQQIQSLLPNSKPCHIIFFDNQQSYSQYQASHNNKATNAMLIGQTPDFIDLGGHINFIRIGGKIRFEINPEQLEVSGIKVSSKVIRLGKVKMRSHS